MQGYGNIQGYMNDPREDLECNQLFQGLGQTGEEHKDSWKGEFQLLAL